jgi:hypothetical protein
MPNGPDFRAAQHSCCFRHFRASSLLHSCLLPSALLWMEQLLNGYEKLFDSHASHHSIRLVPFFPTRCSNRQADSTKMHSSKHYPHLPDIFKACTVDALPTLKLCALEQQNSYPRTRNVYGGGFILLYLSTWAIPRFGVGALYQFLAKAWSCPDVWKPFMQPYR